MADSGPEESAGLEAGSMGEILIVGLSHKTAPIEVRERLAIPPEELREELHRLAGFSSILEVVCLSTCNRVEVVAVSSEPERAIADLRGHLAGKSAGPSDGIADHAYRYQGLEAVRHLFRVASSLDSMIVGEPQILGQIKDAYTAAAGGGTAGPVLHKLFHRTFRVAKRIRTETGVGRGSVSVGYAAVELARKIFDTLDNKNVMLIGAGKVADLTARSLVRSGVRGIMVTNRTFERAIESAKAFSGNAVRFEDLPRYLGMADVIIGSSGGSMILTRSVLEEVVKARRHRPILMMDLGVPRNFDPAINALNDVYLYDIDDLEGVIEDNRQGRAEDAHHAEMIAGQEAEGFLHWLASLQSVPTIVELQEKFEAIRLRELEKGLGRLGDLSPRQLEAIHAMTQSIIKKILHTPISLVKSPSTHLSDLEAVSVVRRVFGLDEED